MATAFVTPRAREREALPAIVEIYRRGAEHAQCAGFDGVELHGAIGYLLDQFLQSKTNLRAMNTAAARSKTAHASSMRWMWPSPSGARTAWACISPRAPTRTTWATRILPRPSAMSPTNSASAASPSSPPANPSPPPRPDPELKKAFGGVYIANQQFTQVTAEQTIAAGEADAVAFGVLFNANPNLPQRLATGAPLNAPDPAAFYSPGPKGYTDYPALAPEPSIV